jgi:hypothetical protein
MQFPGFKTLKTVLNRYATFFRVGGSIKLASFFQLFRWQHPLSIKKSLGSTSSRAPLLGNTVLLIIYFVTFFLLIENFCSIGGWKKARREEKEIWISLRQTEKNVRRRNAGDVGGNGTVRIGFFLNI